MSEEEKDSIGILENTDLDINTIYGVDLHTYNYAVKTALNLIQKQQEEIKHWKKGMEIVDKDHRNYIEKLELKLEKKDKIIDAIQMELREHVGFENRLKRENREPDLFNQGRFYVANNINNILKGK